MENSVAEKMAEMLRTEETTTEMELSYNIEGIDVEMRVETCGGERLDTAVAINGKHVCVIAGSDIDGFLDGLRDLITRYAI